MRPFQRKEFLECLTRLLKGRRGDEDRPFSQQATDSAENETMAYKLLILDAQCRDIVAPLMKVHQLRALGITLHLSIESERQPIEEVPFSIHSLFYCLPKGSGSVFRQSKCAERRSHDSRLEQQALWRILLEFCVKDFEAVVREFSSRRCQSRRR